MKKTVHSPVASGIIILITIALVSWILIAQQGAVTETTDVGGQGIKKLQEIKIELETPVDQAQP